MTRGVQSPHPPCSICGEECRRADSQFCSIKCRGVGRRTHGARHTKAYKAWSEIRQRCHNPNNRAYKWYGARGITVCDRWRENFDAFLADMGQPGTGQSLDRIDNDEGYSPSNCRWADKITQMNNMRSNRRVTVRGESMTMTQAAQRYGVKVATAWARMTVHGWSEEDAFLRPVRSANRRVPV